MTRARRRKLFQNLALIFLPKASAVTEVLKGTLITLLGSVRNPQEKCTRREAEAHRYEDERRDREKP